MTYADDMRQRRDREVERVGARAIVTVFTTKVVGVSFVPTYPDNLYALDRMQRQIELDCLDWEEIERLPAILVRNPNNEYDPNAIQVHVPALGDEMGFIGHLTRPIAARLAPEIDASQPWRAEVVSVLIDPDHLDRPGITIRCDRAPQHEQE